MKNTQTSDILQHLKDGKRLTQKEAINEYGAYRLSGIIHSLRRQGYDIISIPLSVPTRYKCKNGEPRMANVVEYKLNDEWETIMVHGIERQTKKEKALDDIFKSDYQGILDDEKTKKKTFDERLMAFLKEITQ
jgi:hypothetical protein